MNKKTNVFIKLKNSVSNIREFPKYMKEGVGRAFIYALVLALICGLTTGIVSSVNLHNSIKDAVENLKKDKNKFSIESGVLSAESSPIKIEEGNNLIYIDDNMDLDKAEGLRNITVNSDSYILLLKDGISIKSDMITQTKMNYKDLFGEETIDTNYLVSNIEFSEKFIIVIFILLILVKTFVSYIINAVFIGLLSMITNFILGLKLRFSDLFSLVIYTATLPTILVSILNIFMPQVYFNSAGIVGTLLLTLLVLRNIRKDINDNINIQ